MLRRTIILLQGSSAITTIINMDNISENLFPAEFNVDCLTLVFVFLYAPSQALKKYLNYSLNLFPFLRPKKYLNIRYFLRV